MFKDFNWSLLDSKLFKEDAVREELIAPLLCRLGYSASGKNRICRSVPLTHPFVMLGTTKHKINIVPDYTFEVGGRKCWILEAKSPWESTYGKSAQQAYSYGVHPDVAAPYYAVCNGKRFTVYAIFRAKKILDFKLPAIESNWEQLMALLGPEAFLDEPRFTIEAMIKMTRQINAIVDGLGGLRFPISIESIRDAISILQATKESRYRIDLTGKDYRFKSIFGTTLRYKRRIEISYSLHLNLCYKRFAVCNELCSIVFPSNRHSQLDDVSRPMEALGALAPSLSADVETEVSTLRLLAMVEILIPWRLRNEIAKWQTKGMSTFEITTKLRVPSQVFDFFLKSYKQQSGVIHERLDAENERFE